MATKAMKAMKASNPTVLTVYNIYEEGSELDLNVSASSPGAALDRAIALEEIDINDRVLKITQSQSVYI